MDDKNELKILNSNHEDDILRKVDKSSFFTSSYEKRKPLFPSPSKKYFSSGQMFAIECNPRPHSNITLMDTRRQQAAEAIYRALETGDMNNKADKQTIAVPDPSQKHIIWTYNELAKLLHGKGESCT